MWAFIEARRFYNNNTNRDTGTFTFASTTTFLAGNANGFTVTLGDVSTAIAQGALGLFFQDNYRIRTNLSFELGFRWDWLMSPTERFDRFVDYIPQTNSLVQVNHGVAPVYHTNWKNFQPRIGFSWDPFKNGKSSVRGGIGVFYDILKGEDNLQFNGQAPFFGFTSLGLNPTSNAFSASQI